MSDLAASGGYYISCAADYIYAEPTTLTGSIGIFGTIPNVKKIRDKVGLDIDGVGTHKHSTMGVDMIYNGMNSEEQAMMQAMIERGYDLFTRRCADGRKMSQDDIKKIAEGRVWLGKDAKQIGLVDDIKDPKKVEMQLRELIPPEKSSDFCHRLVLHGRAVCDARKPQCDVCTLRDVCQFCEQEAEA